MTTEGAPHMRGPFRPDSAEECHSVTAFFSREPAEMRTP